MPIATESYIIINMKNKNVYNLILSAMFMAIGILLPFITAQIRYIGNMLLPMHIPILLCGLICGWRYGAAVGFITPLLRSALFGMPVLFPNAIGMAFELAAYGFLIGFIYCRFQKKNLLALYVALLAAILGGRIIWGVARTLLFGVGGEPFTLSLFITNAFITAIPGIVLQLILIPSVMILLKLMKKRKA